ncbi:hypothetical protein JXC34_06860 [Candidatus Woesearchaeota archaeon]|nr:hypothetical protein [Candidatus Woesearchaeota archaeon]
MTELVALLSTGKGTWSEVIKLMNSQEWDKIFLITNEFGSTTFKKNENMEFIVINQNESIELLIDHIQKQLKERISGTEVALNLISGTGKEHMAVLSALLKTGVGIRLITHTINGIKEI